MKHEYQRVNVNAALNERHAFSISDDAPNLLIRPLLHSVSIDPKRFRLESDRLFSYSVPGHESGQNVFVPGLSLYKVTTLCRAVKSSKIMRADKACDAPEIHRGRT